MQATDEAKHTNFNVRTNALIEDMQKYLVNENDEYPPRYTSRLKEPSSDVLRKWQSKLDDTVQLFSQEEIVGIVKHKLFICQALIDYLGGNESKALASFNHAYWYERGSQFEYYEDIYKSLGGHMPKKSNYDKRPHDTYELEQAMVSANGKVPLYKHLTVGLPYMISNHFSTWSEEEIDRYAFLRGIEWLAWPAFLSMGIGALLLLVTKPLNAAMIVIVLNVLWSAIAKSFINLTFANIGVYINKLKFVTTPVLVVYFLVNHNLMLAVFAALWPLFSMFASLVRFGDKNGFIAYRFKQMIYERIK